LIVIFVIAVIGAAIFVLAKSTGGVTVPNVVGQSESEAFLVLKRMGLEMVVSKRVIDPSKPSGIVISQDPAAGRKVSKGGKVEVVVSKGAELVEVPNCIGLTQSEASSRITAAGLTVGNISYSYSQNIQKDKVASQNPEAGSKVAKGTEVDLVISKGPEMVIVPQVVGLNVDTAKQQLEEAGFSVDIKEVESETQAEGTVTEQEPAAGQKAPKGSKVVISVVKKPEKVEVPNVIGMDRNTAVTTLTSAGFTVTVVDKQTTDVSKVGKVIDQSPGANTLVNKGERVTIYVGVSSTS
jgi:serine/threonine-protein kinase